MLILLQARMSSSRLPGKILRPIKQGIHVLDMMIERLLRSQFSHQIMVLTSTHPSDDILAIALENKKIAIRRGSLMNVASRFYEAVSEYQPSHFMRLCADSPWIDPTLLDSFINESLQHPSSIITNLFPRTFPKGQSFEIIPTAYFVEAYSKMEEEDLEHVTSYFYRHASHYSIRNISSPCLHSNISQAIDTETDWRRFENAFYKHADQWREIDWDQIDQTYATLITREGMPS